MTILSPTIPQIFDFAVNPPSPSKAQDVGILISPLQEGIAVAAEPRDAPLRRSGEDIVAADFPTEPHLSSRGSKTEILEKRPFNIKQAIYDGFQLSQGIKPSFKGKLHPGAIFEGKQMSGKSQYFVKVTIQVSLGL
jgi:hypothetical protein